MKNHWINLFSLALLLMISGQINCYGQQLTAAGIPVQLTIARAGTKSIRITTKPLSYKDKLPDNPALADDIYAKPELILSVASRPVKKQIGDMNILVSGSPLTITITTLKNQPIQRLCFNTDGTVSIATGNKPVLGMGEGGHKPEPGKDWRTQPIEFDRNSRFQEMQPRWQSDAYGSRNPVPMLIGTGGWGLFVSSPWVRIDLRDKATGVLIPWKPNAKDSVPQTAQNQGLDQSKGLPPATTIVKGLYDIFVFDAHEPANMMKDISLITGPAVMPPKWAMGYMQSHRTIRDEKQILGIVDTFRLKQIPIDAVIYLGSGFAPRGWNNKQPSFEFNPDVFLRDPKDVLADFHAKHVKVVVHIVPYDRDKLPTLHGSIPAKAGETLDAGHIQNYWKKHEELMRAGVDAFWPDEGDWFNLFERIKRHQLYYEGPISTLPNIRPWSLHRNGYLGIAKWGGWIWSGDTESSWKTLEGQIADGINSSLSLSPYWGSDIGGFYATPEKTGELYARWYQFGAFCPSFRSHGRDWHTSLPWGWGLKDMGVVEDYNKRDTANRLIINQAELNNPAIEPVIKKYDELRYRLLPYNYTLAWQAHYNGMPFMRALWLYYPTDAKATITGDEYFWGPSMLIAPVYEKGAASKAIYLPKGTWYDWWTNEKQTGGTVITRKVDLSVMPIYVKAGAIIPFDPIRQYTAELVDEPTTIKVYRGSNGSFTLYDDDGNSLEYLKRKGSWINFSWNDKLQQLVIQPGPPAGNFINMQVHKKFIIELLPGKNMKTVNYENRPLTVTFL